MTLLERTDSLAAGARRATILRTERLVLRPPQPGDAPAIASLASDIRVAENTLRIPHPYTLADARDFLAAPVHKRDELTFVVTAGGDVLGCCGIVTLGHEHPEIGYWLGVPFWGQGYGTEVARALVDHAFTDLDLAVLLAGARVSNPASRRVLEKCGFQWTGVGLYRFRALASSAPVDRFRLDRGLWASLRAWGNPQGPGWGRRR